MKRWIVLVVGALVIVLVVVLWPVPLPPRFAGHLSEEDHREIALFVRREAYERSFEALKQNDLAGAWHWFRSARRHRIWSAGQPEDEGVWIQVGVDDKSHPDGYRVIARYVTQKESGRWNIRSSY